MLLLLALFFCHYLGDYTQLSRPSMLAAKRFGKPFGPIMQHALVHALLMGVVLLCFGVRPLAVWLLFVFQLWSHAGIDWLKGRCTYWFPVLQDAAAPAYWYVFGFDQFAHTAIILLMWRATWPA